MSRLLKTALSLAALAAAMPAEAQVLGTFRWQLQPYCNIVSVTVTQVGSIYRLEGTDDQCSAGGALASVIGTAYPNPDGSVGLGLNIVSTPGGLAVPIDAAVTMATLSGTWSDGAGHSGPFTLTPGTGTGGSPRPEVAPGAIPGVFGFQPDGGFVARGLLNTGDIPASGLGTRMMWYPRKAAFRAGHLTIPAWDDVNVGIYSTAFGLNTVAAGPKSTALGEESLASGERSIAFGYNAIASGINSLAGGELTTASGANSAAFGRNTTASGANAVAIGTNTLASGAYAFAGGANTTASATSSLAFGAGSSAGGNLSVAIGRNAVTSAAAHGSFILADDSTTSAFVSVLPNEFGARFAGGYYLYTRADLGTGVAVAANGSSWAALSDANAKEHFRDVDGEDLLARLARVPIREWSYKAQDAAIRHMGPTAQDFRAAFGLGDFPLRINTIDADGVALAGVKALDARTRALQDENAALREAVDRLRREVAALKAAAIRQ